MAAVVTSENLTVIVPAFNEEESVGATVRSLREQTLTPSRIVVVDDCSSDETAAAA
jgi:glycosyltransferase involved in cell wall biosynthesis